MLSAKTKSFGWMESGSELRWECALVFNSSIDLYKCLLQTRNLLQNKQEVCVSVLLWLWFSKCFFLLFHFFWNPWFSLPLASKSKRATSHTANSLKCLPVSHNVWETLNRSTSVRVSRSLSAEWGKTKWFGEKEAIKGEKGGRGRTVNHWQIMPHAKLSWIKHPPSLAVAAIQVFSLPAFASSLTSLSLTRMINPRRP